MTVVAVLFLGRDWMWTRRKPRVPRNRHDGLPQVSWNGQPDKVLSHVIWMRRRPRPLRVIRSTILH